MPHSSMSGPDDFLAFEMSLGPTVWRFAVATDLGGLARLFSRILGLSPEAAPAKRNRASKKRTVYLVPATRASVDEPPAALFRSSEGSQLSRSGWERIPLPPGALWRHPAEEAVILQVFAEMEDKNRVAAMNAACLPVYIWAVESGGFPLHAALISREGTAVALAAPGGTGKSTCARRIPPPWVSLGDDLALVVPDKGETSGYMVHVLPTWSEYAFERSQGTWRTEERLPLRAVFFLSRGAEDGVLPVGQAEAAIKISQSAYQVLAPVMRGFPLHERRVLLTGVFDNASLLSRAVPVYFLEASLSGAFWNEIERVL